jgi:hypothetical protein
MSRTSYPLSITLEEGDRAHFNISYVSAQIAKQSHSAKFEPREGECPEFSKWEEDLHGD